MTATLVAGAGGALGGHLVRRLLDDGYEVKAVDIKPPDEWWQWHERAENHAARDLSTPDACAEAVEDVEWVYSLAADMGGIGHIESHRADCAMSVLITANMLRAAELASVRRFWYASSACVYPAGKQNTAQSGYGLLKEGDAIPADPEAGYGWEKLYGELLCQYFAEEKGLTTRIGRLHNVYGPHSTWTGGREKAPAALCRKVAEAVLTGSDELHIWGDGGATRSFLHVDDFVEGAIRLMESDYPHPINLGSEEVVTVNELADLVEEAAGTRLTRIYDTSKPQGVRGRGSDNTLLRQVTGWEPQVKLRDGIAELYAWVNSQVAP